MQFHPNDLSLLAVLQPIAASSRPEVLKHLQQCSRCRLRLKGLERLGAAAPKLASRTHNYDFALDRAQERVQIRVQGLAQEHKHAEDLFARLMERAADEQYMAVRYERSLQTWSILSRLISKGKQQVFQDPARSEDLLHVALELTNHLDPFYGTERIEDMRARSWAAIGNTRRVRSDMRGAEEAFGLAYSHLQHGTKDALEKAGVLELEASLLRSQKQYSSALERLQRALSIFRQFGDQHRAGRVLILSSLTRNYAGDPEQSLSLLHQASRLIDYGREPRLLLDLLHNFVNTLVDLGRPQQAQSVFLRLTRLYEDFPSRSTRPAQNFLEGKIARGLGQKHEAELFFTVALDGFLSKGMTVQSQAVAKELMRTSAFTPH